MFISIDKEDKVLITQEYVAVPADVKSGCDKCDVPVELRGRCIIDCTKYMLKKTGRFGIARMDNEKVD